MKRAVAVCAALLLSACASTPERFSQADVEGAWQAHRAQVIALSAWKTQARVALRTPEQTGSASLVWTYTPARQTMHLFGPFGAGRVSIVQDAGGATLLSGSRRYQAADAGSLLQKATGWYLPLDGFAYWARGLPSPGAAEVLYDRAGRVTRLVQSGWVVDYVAYQRFGDLDLPVNIVFTRPHDNHDSMDVRVIIQDWDFGFAAS